MSRGRPEGDYGPRGSDPGPYRYGQAGGADDRWDEGDSWRPAGDPHGYGPQERGGGHRDRRDPRAAKRGRDRRSGDRGQGQAREPGPGGPGADEDYDWIKYLGEGRSPSPAASPSSTTPPSQRLSRPLGRPRNDLPQSRPEPVGGDWPEPPPRPLPVRELPSRELPSRPAPAPRALARPDPVPRPGQSKMPPGDYQRPLYDDLTPDQSIPSSRSMRAISPPPAEPWLDSREYKRPLYPPEDADPETTAPGRRRPDPNLRAGPPTSPGLRPTPARGRALPPGGSVADRSSAIQRSRVPDGAGRPVRPDSADDWIPSRAATDPGLRAPRRPVRDQAARPGRPAPSDRVTVERRPPGDKPSDRDLSREGPGTASGTAVRAEPDRRSPARPAAPARTGRAPGRSKRKQAGAAKSPGSAGQRTARKPESRVAGSSPQRPPRRPARTPAARLLKMIVRLPRRILIVSGCLILALLAGGAYWLLRPQPAHTIAIPAQLGAFAKQPATGISTANSLRNKIVAGAAGEVKNVVAAAYERTTGPGTSQGPQVIVFIGGNLTGGGSASGFIGGFISQLPGSFSTSAGRLGGLAACAPGSKGGPAECAWADDDTFGVIVSATLAAPGLADELRVMRPLVEHAAR